MADRLAGRYEVLRTVSQGPRATVLQALDHVHDRLVALKVFPVTLDDRDALLAEARLLMSMAPHPALPVVRGDFFTDPADRYVVVLNWVEGADLQQILDDEGDPGLPLDEVIDALAIVAGALDHLHAHDPPIIHGDVKPANLVRTPNGGVVLVDFDIAGAESARGRVGTVGYVAPEVMAGEKPGPAADVYGLAATAVTLLNGRPAIDAAPAYPGLEPEVQAQVGRVLRAALSVDPARRPRAAGRLIENLRRAQRVEPASGVVALLAAEVADASRLWDQDADGMRTAMGRLRDLRDVIVEGAGGRVMTSMNEGDRMIAVFREASTAAEAALTLQDRAAREHFPPGLDVRLRVAIAVGEATFADGVYSGAVVDKVVQLRAIAAPGTTVTSESTAELLLGLVGHDVSIVSLGEVQSSGALHGRRLFALTRPGFEHTVAADSASTDEPSDPVAQERVGSTILLEALQDPSTLVPLTICGVAGIFVVVLAPVLGDGALGIAVVILSALVAVVSFARRYAASRAAWRADVDAATRDADEAAKRREEARARTEERRRLERAFAQLDTEHADEAERVLGGLADEFEAIGGVFHRNRQRTVPAAASALPELADETYRTGMSALSDALELFEFAGGPLHDRLQAELHDIDDRLDNDAYADERARARDQQRRASHASLLARHDESRQHGCDLVFEAERCTAALAATRIELASIRAGDRQIDADAVVRTLQDAITCVRAVQDELRTMGY